MLWGKWIKIAQVEFSSITGRVSLSIIFLLSVLFYSFLEMCKGKASLWIFSLWSVWLKWKLRTTQATPHLTKHMYLCIFPVVLCPSQERLSPCRSIGSSESRDLFMPCKNAGLALLPVKSNTYSSMLCLVSFGVSKTNIVLSPCHPPLNVYIL